MKIIRAAIPDVLIFEPKVFGDERGFFMETYRESYFQEAGLDVNFVQDNHSLSTKSVLRGLHYQRKKPQGKLVRVVIGEIFDVAVDIRKESETFGQWVGLLLSADNKRQLYIPPGFAHGFLVLSDVAECEYKCTDYYCPEDQGEIAWNDPDIDIQWPATDPILSEKDAQAPLLKSLDL